MPGYQMLAKSQGCLSSLTKYSARRSGFGFYFVPVKRRLSIPYSKIPSDTRLVNNPATQTLTMVDAERLDVPQKLPTIPANSSDNIWRITKETLVGCMDGQFDQYFDHMIIIDCRFRYEYNGGHIDGAISLAPRSGSLVDTNLLDDLISSKSHQMRTVICFYCCIILTGIQVLRTIMSIS
ncbi:hypothetical protein FOXB_02665 [Fusarium oxysporum f. sp. conglutinans Fo5176]|uniref:protein-tyrosine-phosphatase n=1 Tax=Fusarium oxysporum (strain Fo5176) TaxID=660025 RepID=F9F8E0_FUSOF|nr:hypothetical protein FOXB_02665 [Fusarium oxysporum f. sp. conglutinans Fo5176]